MEHAAEHRVSAIDESVAARNDFSVTLNMLFVVVPADT